MPSKIFSMISSAKCKIIRKKGNNFIDIINSETNEKIVTLISSQYEENSEMVYTIGNSIEYTLPVKKSLQIDLKSIANIELRPKTPRKKEKQKEILDFPSEFITPIITANDISDETIMREHIKASLKYIKDNVDESDQRLALSEVIDSLKTYKINSKIEPIMEELKKARKRRNIPDMTRFLSVIANKL